MATEQISRQAISGRRYPEKGYARRAVQVAIEKGELVRPDYCSRCFVACKPDGHHPDYGKPLQVIWLCGRCHKDEHVSLNARRTKAARLIVRLAPDLQSEFAALAESENKTMSDIVRELIATRVSQSKAA